MESNGMENTGKASSGKDMLKNMELSAFCAQTAMIMKSGIPVSEGVSIMQEDMKSAQGKALLGQIGESLEVGSTLCMALEKTGKFPKYVIDMTELGERTGRLDNVMESLNRYYEREEAISKNIRNAVTYPMVMIVMMAMVIVVLMVKVLPIFNEVFVQLGSEMTGISKRMMDLGQVIGRYSIVFIVVLAVLALCYFIGKQTKTGKRIVFNFKNRFIGTRKIMARIASGRFASAMSMMLASGLDIDQSLEMAQKFIDNPHTNEKIDKCREFMKNGENFSDALVKAEIFTGVYSRMISVGFKTGSVDTVMDKVSQMYDDEIQSRIGNVISVLEPTLVAVLSIIMGMILLSVMMPLLGIMTSIG